MGAYAVMSKTPGDRLRVLADQWFELLIVRNVFAESVFLTVGDGFAIRLYLANIVAARQSRNLDSPFAKQVTQRVIIGLGDIPNG